MSLSGAAARLRTTLDLFEAGEGMMRQRIRRQRPTATPAQVEQEISAWLQHRPGAEHGDHPGPRSTRRL